MFLNKLKEKQRIASGKPAKIQNSSMRSRYEADTQVDNEGRLLGEQAFSDLTDRQNDEVSCWWEVELRNSSCTRTEP